MSPFTPSSAVRGGVTDQSKCMHCVAQRTTVPPSTLNPHPQPSTLTSPSTLTLHPQPSPSTLTLHPHPPPSTLTLHPQPSTFTLHPPLTPPARTHTYSPTPSLYSCKSRHCPYLLVWCAMVSSLFHSLCDL